jgi:hypothetical protein
VRQGIGFLRTELPTILATRTDALSPRMLRVIEELAGDWRSSIVGASTAPTSMALMCRWRSRPQHQQRKSVDLSITSSADSSSMRHLGFICNGRRGSASSGHFIGPIAFLASVFGLTGQSKRNLINV